MRIYTAPGVIAYTIGASKLNTNINLPKGTYTIVVQAWDKCGGMGKTTVNVTVSSINGFAFVGVEHRVVVHPSGKFVYASSTSGSSSFAINGFAVQSDSSLKPVPGSPFTYLGPGVSR